MIAHFVIFCVVVAAAVSIPFIVGAIVVLHINKKKKRQQNETIAKYPVVAVIQPEESDSENNL